MVRKTKQQSAEFDTETIIDRGDQIAGDDVDAFVATVGERVRQARQRKGIPRRVLSDLSGVSQRYLAQLEGGSGNISIALLFRVAQALDHRVESLVANDAPWDHEITHLAELFRSASQETRDKVLRVLDHNEPVAPRHQRICLIGLRGAGKSTLGKLAGKSLNLPFVELNREIEKQVGMPVEEVMALYGQEGYRKLERQAVEHVAATSDALVLAVAGGIVSDHETYTFVLHNFHTIWLRAQPQEHMDRVREQGDDRPMAGNAKAMEDLRSILTSREALYARAGSMVDTSGKTLEQSHQELLSVIGKLPIMAPSPHP